MTQLIYNSIHDWSKSETYSFTGKPYSSVTVFYYDYQHWYDRRLDQITRFPCVDAYSQGLLGMVPLLLTGTETAKPFFIWYAHRS